MKESPDYISHKNYIDSPAIYGHHAQFWSALSFSEKVYTIRRVGFFSFLREVLGFADAERTRARLEQKHGALCSEYEAMRDRVLELEQENQKLEQKLKQIEQARHGEANRLLTPPSARDIMKAFNRSSPGRAELFYNPHEDPDTGVVTLEHNFAFYPFARIKVPRGKLRFYDQYGTVANLAQCEAYDALPAKYAQHLIPEGFQAHRMKVLFVTDDHYDFWLAEPRSAQDILLEIWARYDAERFVGSRQNADINKWKERYDKYNAMFSGTYGQPVFSLIVPVEKLLSEGQNNFSKERIDRIRNKCYTEYLDIYFRDQYDEDS